MSSAPACVSPQKIGKGDTFADISRRCYGSRTYAEWLASHTKPKALRAGKALEIPAFATLVEERLAPKWKGEAGAIVDAFTHYRNAEGEIESALSAAPPGVASYHPSAHAKAELDASAAALRPLVQRLRDAGVRTKKFAQALESVERLAAGSGSFSTDYATEELHQCFSYGVDALGA